MSQARDDLRNLLLQGGILLAIAAGTVAIVGFLRDATYLNRLGVPILGQTAPVHHYMIQSFSVLLLPFTLFLIYPGVESSFAWVKSRGSGESTAKSPRELFQWFSAPSVAAGLSLFAAAKAFASIGDGSPVIPLLDWTAIDALVWFFLAVLLGLIIWTQLGDDQNPYGALLGDTTSGHLFLVALAVTGLCIAGTSVGAQEGSDAAWGCVDLPIITFTPQPEPLNTSRDYWLIMHTDGTYYVRDLTLKGDVREHRMVQDRVIQSANVSWAPPIRDC